MMPQTSTESVSAYNSEEMAINDDCSDSATNDNSPETKSELRPRIVTPAKDWPNLKPNIKAYNMTSKPRGEALIIEIQEFSHPDLQFRDGSQIDTQNLKELFTQLDFNVTLHKDLPGNEMRKTIRKFAQSFETIDADMCIVAILSHGTDKEVFASDGAKVRKEYIFEKFNNVECEGLRYKPKFFIIQSCQGETRDYGKEKDDTGRPESGFEKKMTPKEKQRKDPSYTDMMIVQSTVPGYVSNRDKDGSCWFIQCLCDVIREQATDTHLSDMLDQVAIRLTSYQSEDGTVQSFTSEKRTFTKKLYFNPGLYKNKNAL